MQPQSKKILFASLPHSYFTLPLLSAFSKLGYQIKVFNFQKPTPTSRIFGFIHAKNLYIQEVNRALINAANNYHPHILFVIKGDPITPQTIRTLNNQGITTINWFPDWLISWNWLKHNTHS